MEQEAAAAVPLWINGHAYLTVPAAFYDVRSPLTGEVLRRTPLCGAGVAHDAVAAARDALPPWAARTFAGRAGLLTALAEALAAYAAHFAALLAEETGAPAAAEVDVALALLRCAPDSMGCHRARIVGICAGATAPLCGPLRLAVPALLAGAVVIIKPDPATPSALVALAELTARCDFPGGVFSVVHGAEAVVDGLHADGVEMVNA